MPSPSADRTAVSRRHVATRRRVLLTGAMVLGLLLPAPVVLAQEGLVIPPPETAAPAASGLQTAVFAGGCFWGVQGVFQRVEGVTNAVSGYAGGAAATAQYKMVGRGDTGHAEAVRITFDPAKVSYGQLLQIFFSAAHDPTQLNRQGPDVGTQYRTAIFPQDDAQASVARAYIDQLNRARIYDAAIVTSIEPGQTFYPAEGYHQDYLTNNPDQPYIVYNDLPKIEHLKQLFPDLWRETPVLVAEAGIDG